MAKKSAEEKVKVATEQEQTEAKPPLTRELKLNEKVDIMWKAFKAGN